MERFEIQYECFECSVFTVCRPNSNVWDLNFSHRFLLKDIGFCDAWSLVWCIGTKFYRESAISVFRMEEKPRRKKVVRDYGVRRWPTLASKETKKACGLIRG
jgi:hypothetical protein